MTADTLRRKKNHSRFPGITESRSQQDTPMYISLFINPLYAGRKSSLGRVSNTITTSDSPWKLRIVATYSSLPTHFHNEETLCLTNKSFSNTLLRLTSLHSLTIAHAVQSWTCLGPWDLNEQNVVWMFIYELQHGCLLSESFGNRLYQLVLI